MYAPSYDSLHAAIIFGKGKHSSTIVFADIYCCKKTTTTLIFSFSTGDFA